MQIRVNGETVKCFGGERDWTTYAYAFDADGEYTVSVAYCKDEASEDGEDILWIDTIELLSGDAAAAAVDANPAYLFGDATTLTVTNPDAKEIVFDDPSQLPENTTFYIVPGGTADILLTLAPLTWTLRRSSCTVTMTVLSPLCSLARRRRAMRSRAPLTA